MTEIQGTKRNNAAVPADAPEAAGAILIEKSREIYAERLELCVLRSASFDAEKTDPSWRVFLGKCLTVLEALRQGKSNPATEKHSEAAEYGTTMLCKLQRFWFSELSLLCKTESLSPEIFVPAWETTLQILLEAESAKTENVPVNEKEVRDILYSYFYDYAEDLLTGTSRGFLPEFLAGEDTEHVQDGLSLFFGDRLKARLLDILEKQQRGNVPLCRQGTFPLCLTPHQKKALAEFWKKAALLMAVLLLTFSLTACGGSSAEETEETAVQTVQTDENAYPGTVAYVDSEQEINDTFGIMHATVLDVQNGEKDGLFIYTLRDREDPDNAWCLNSQDVGSIVCTVTGGKEVAVLFSGDIINDPDSVEFIAILDDASYAIKETEGTTISNMMNSFTIRTDRGVELNFIKDNCKVDRDALSTDPGAHIRIYYTEGGTSDHYPLRVYKLPR